jgi:hypothetical protein
MHINQGYDFAEIQRVYSEVVPRKAFHRSGEGIVLTLYEQNTHDYLNHFAKEQRQLWMQVNSKKPEENRELQTVARIRGFFKRKGAEKYLFLGELRFVQFAESYCVLGLQADVDLALLP